jgi:hypothetical protein
MHALFPAILIAAFFWFALLIAWQFVKLWARVIAIFCAFGFVAFVAGCTTQKVSQPVVPLVSYSNAFEREAGSELANCKQKNLCIMVEDYLKLRCAIRWVKPCAKLIPEIRPSTR